MQHAQCKTYDGLTALHDLPLHHKPRSDEYEWAVARKLDIHVHHSRSTGSAAQQKEVGTKALRSLLLDNSEMLNRNQGKAACRAEVGITCGKYETVMPTQRLSESQAVAQSWCYQSELIFDFLRLG